MHILFIFGQFHKQNYYSISLGSKLETFNNLENNLDTFNGSGGQK